MEELNAYHWWQIISGGISLVAAIAAGTVAYIQNKHEKAMTAIQKNSDTLKKSQNEHSNAITELKTTIKNLPEFKNMEQLRSDLHKVDNKVSHLAGKLKTNTSTLVRIESYLLNNKEGCNGK